MVPASLEWLWQIGKEVLTIVFDHRWLAVHDPGNANDISAIRFRDALVSKTNTEDRNFCTKDTTTSLLIPASRGVHGPGEIQIRSGARAEICASEISSLRLTTTSQPSSPKYC